MAQNLCTRTERGLRGLGYARKAAQRFAGFFYVTMMSVYGLFGLLDGWPEFVYIMSNGTGTSIADARAASLLSTSRIQRC